MKNLLICTSSNQLTNLLLKDIGAALSANNFNVTYVDFHLEKYKFRDEYYWFNNCAEKVYEANPDFILFFGMEGIVTLNDVLPTEHLWDVLSIPFLTFTFGSPVKTVYGAIEVGESGLCLACVNERSYIDHLKSFGFSNIFYMPLATNPQRFAPGKGTYPKGFNESADISFVGGLKNMQRLTWNRFTIASLRLPSIIQEIRTSGQPVDRVIQKYVEDMVDHDELTRSDFSPDVSTELYGYCTDEADFLRRKDIIESLSSYTVNAGGSGWESEAAENLSVLNRVDYENELPAVYNKSNISLGISSYEHVTSISANVFDCFAAGGFMLPDKKEDITRLFKQGYDIDCYATKTELNDKVKKYLSEPALREDMAGKAREHVLKEHTWEQRAAVIIEEMERFAGEHKPFRAFERKEDLLVSAVIIARNEGKNIRTCLESLEDHVDEIVLVDTGSIDNTPEIARLHGANLFFIEWKHNFSYARNFALSRARGKWVLVIDADELYIPSESRPSIEEIVKNAPDNILGFNVMLRGNEGEEKPEIRLFRNGKGLMYEGAVNEWLSLEDKERVSESRILIKNTRVPGSEEGNAIISKAIRNGLGTLHMIFNMMEIVNREGNLNEVKRYGEMFLQNTGDQSLIHSRYRRAYSMLSNVYLQKDEPEKALEIAFSVLNENPQDLEMWFLMGKIYNKIKNYQRIYLAYRNFNAIPASSSHPKAPEFENLIAGIPDKYLNEFNKCAFEDMTISVCVVYKSDFDGLESLLQNVLEFASEVIIGNNTNLPETEIPVFPGEKIRMYDIPDAFSMAGAWNELKEVATREWILFLEPDERIDPDSLLLLKDLINLFCNEDTMGCNVICDNISKHGILFREAPVRILRREDGPDFEGDAYPTVEAGTPLAQLDIRINNPARDLNLQRFFEEARFKQQVLEFDRSEDVDNCLLYYQLARVYDDVQNYQLAVVNAQKGLSYCQEDGEIRNEERIKYLYGLIVRGLLAIDCDDEAEKFAAEMVDKYPLFLDAYFYSVLTHIFNDTYTESMERAVDTYFQLREKLFKGIYHENAPLFGLFQDGGVRIVKGGLNMLKGEVGLDLIMTGLYETKGNLPEFVKKFLKDNTETILDATGVKDMLEKYKDSVDCLFLLIHLASFKEETDEKVSYLDRLSDISSFYRADASYYKAEVFVEKGRKQLAVAHYITAVNEYQRILSEGYRVPQEMLVRYAEALERTGKVTAAIAIYEVLLKVARKSDAEMIRIKINQLRALVDDRK